MQFNSRREKSLETWAMASSENVYGKRNYFLNTANYK